MGKHSRMRAIVALSGRLEGRQTGNVAVRQKSKKGDKKSPGGLLVSISAKDHSLPRHLAVNFFIYIS